jgi:hypothetical protein
MYSHPEINYKPQHPMLKQQRQPYTVEDEGIMDSLKAGLSAAAGAIKKGAGAIKKGAKAAMAAGADMLGVSTAPLDKMTKANGIAWHAYYIVARNLAGGKIHQADEYRTEEKQKTLRAKLIEQSGGVISFDDAKKLAGVK